MAEQAQKGQEFSEPPSKAHCNICQDLFPCNLSVPDTHFFLTLNSQHANPLLSWEPLHHFGVNSEKATLIMSSGGIFPYIYTVWQKHKKGWQYSPLYMHPPYPDYQSGFGARESGQAICHLSVNILTTLWCNSFWLTCIEPHHCGKNVKKYRCGFNTVTDLEQAHELDADELSCCTHTWVLHFWAFFSGVL